MLDSVFESLSSGAVAIFSGVSSALDGIVSWAVDGIKNGISQENPVELDVMLLVFLSSLLFLN
ncbi:hypothetical protein MUB42_01950 [Apilactobacillus kunkeei]|nr:hypothetical protein MUB42_01950 [Apilactobacillus kunkeei]